MNTSDLENAFRRILREEIRAALDELRLFLQRSIGPQPAKPEPEMLLTSREAAKRLAISEKHLYTLTRTNRLPCVRVGNSKRYSIETIKNWIEQVEANPQPSSSPVPRPASSIKPESEERPAKRQHITKPE